MQRMIVLRGKETSKPATKTGLRVAEAASPRPGILIDAELEVWARQYAKRHYTSLPQLVTDMLVALKKEEEGDGIRQI